MKLADLAIFTRAVLFSFALAVPVAYADEVPWLPPPDLSTNEWTTNWTSVDPRLWAYGPASTTLPSSPAPTITFKSIGQSGNGFPPNAYGAVGPNHVVTMNNTDVQIQSRSGTTNSSVTCTAWWASVGSLYGALEARVAYDPYAGRWMAAAHGGSTSGQNLVLYAVSASDDPTGTWYKGKIVLPSGVQADYTALGFNKNWIVASFNMFASGAFSTARVYMFNKTNLYAGGTNCVAQDIPAGGFYDPIPFSLIPATTYDSSLDTLYVVETAGYVHSANVLVHTITGSPGSPTFSPTYKAPAGPVFDYDPATLNSLPQSGGTNKIYAADARMESVCYRDGSIWAAHTVFLPAYTNTQSAILWWEISAATFTALQSGLIQDASASYAYPSIAVNRFHDVLIGYSVFSSSMHGSAAYSFRTVNDTPNQMRSSYTFKSGEDYYWQSGTQNGRNRWGDYSATVVDPLNDRDFWTIQEYAATAVTTGDAWNRGRWALQWANIAVPLSGNDNFTNAYQLTGVSGSTNGSTFRASQESNAETNYVGSHTFGHSVWYQWTAPTNGMAQFNTSYSTNDLDTVIAVCTGTNVSSLTLVAFSDDFRGKDKNFPNLSALSFSATAGATYRIIVDTKTSTIDGFDQFVLTWQQPTDPVIFESPPPETHVLAGDTLTLTSVAGSVPSPTYLWYKGTNAVAGATNASLGLASKKRT
jgi:hypothetical protein